MFGLEEPPNPVNNSIPIRRYLVSLNNLRTQADLYRASGKHVEEYRALFRYASLVVETIPNHSELRNSNNSSKLNQRLNLDRKFLKQNVMPRLELLKPFLKDASRSHAVRKPNVVPVQSTNLPQIDWSKMQPAPGAQQHVPTDFFVSNPTVEQALAHSHAQAGTADPDDPFAASAAYQLPPTQWTAPGQAASQPGTPAPSALAVPGLPDWAASLASRSLDPQLHPKHMLFAPSAASPRYSVQKAAARQGSLYPNVDAIDMLLDRMDISPEKPLALPPQELPVTNQVVMEMPPAPAPGETCSHCAPCGHPPNEPPSSGVVYKAKQELRDVYIAPAVMEEFMHFAKRSTRAGIESCGILAGTLSADDSSFTVTTLIIPKQKGEANTVEMLNEEEIFDFQFERGLLPLGWIHTHPTQTCFLSSVDVHTQCGFQVMLAEAVAIVMAPTDPRSKCGIFRLTTPGGMGVVQECTLKGFHQHPAPRSGQEIYELCGHVFLDESAKYESIDLR